MACAGHLHIFTESLKTDLSTSDWLTGEDQTKYGCDKCAEHEIRATAIAGDSMYISGETHRSVRWKLAVVPTATGHVNPHIRCEWPWTSVRLQ